MTKKGIWAQISINNKTIGWVAKDTLTVTYDKIIEQKMFHYDAVISQGRHDVYTVPGYTKGNVLLTKSSTYLNQKVRILQIMKTNRATWVQFSVNGTTVGWMNSIGLNIKYDAVKETKKVYYDAVIVEGRHDMYTVPGYTNGNELLTKSSAYLNQTVQIIEEKVTDRVTWALVSQNGTTIGWMNKKGVKAAEYNDTVLESRSVHYEALISSNGQLIYSAPGYTKGSKVTVNTKNYYKKNAKIIEEKVTNRATWALVSVNNKTIGWVDKAQLTVQYDSIKNTKTVHYDAVVTQGRHDVYTVPGYTEGNKIITKSSSYLNKKVRIIKTLETNRATWAQFSIDGKTIGWMNIIGLSIQYDKIISSNKVDITAKVAEGRHDIYTIPGYIKGNELITKAETYLNQEVTIVEEKETSRATWALIAQNGKTIGWINKKGLTILKVNYADEIVESRKVHYDSIISKKNQLIYSAPGFTKGAKEVGNTSSYLNKKAQIIQEKVTDRAIWAQISVNGKIVGWMNSIGLTVQYDKVLDTKKVHYDAVVMQGRHDVYSKPGYTENSQRLTKSSTYLNKKAKVTQIVKTNRATWAEISIDGKSPVWMNIIGIEMKYEKVTSTKAVSYNAKVIEGQHDIYTAPDYTEGNTIIGKCGSYLNKNIKVIQEKETVRAGWALIAVNGKTIGWMNKKGLDSISIYLDSGHGGDEPGAISGGIKEKDFNLKVALKVEKLLKEKGYEVVMSRRTDKFVSLSDRAQ